MDLKKWRLHKGLSQRDAAKLFGCSIPHLSRAERGRHLGEDLAFRIQEQTGGAVQAGDLCPTVRKIMERL